MDEPSISYELLVERALRGVLREALTMTREKGLPGQHHFYITFCTHHPDVVMPSRLRAQHPEEMTIVLQHQFWDLEVEPDYFEVSLSFNGRREHLHVPFESVTAFADPFAKFGLQFQLDIDTMTDELLDDMEASESLEDLFPGEPQEASPPRPIPLSEDNKVVTLDAFRKK